MPLSGAHIIAGYASTFRPERNEPILGKVVWSESPATGVTTTRTAPLPHDTMGQAIFRLRSSMDAYFAIGPNPNASASPRVFVPANTDYDVYVEPNDRAQWVAA
ncbi:hypothetical protein FHW37_104585 [Neorhizobium alkalisoli]|uniref:Uncharacterized protein n=1 Tax=Neorhizobium alkalisoli TaxID=528178 RepID=A0A561QSP0_9HYPH|nr:hypothetical protein FHW37_104585 [Neorhizobium alkalisoli]